MRGFVGRQRELALLGDLLDLVRTGGRTGRPGRAVLIRGRRRVGKSRQVEEFAQRAALPHIFFTATGAPREEELASFAAEVAASDLPETARFADFSAPPTWDAALTLLASILPADQPSMVVFDEMPYLAREVPLQPSSSAASGRSRPSSPPRHRPAPCWARSGTASGHSRSSAGPSAASTPAH